MQELSIKVNVADRQYPLRIKASDEENLRKAARKVNARLNEYTENYAVVDKQDALAMIALEFAAEFLSMQENASGMDSDTQQLIRDLETRMDQLLSETRS